MACFLERLGANPSFFRDLAKGETAATEVKRRWNAEGARNAPIAKSLEKPGLETSECKEACHSVNGYGFLVAQCIYWDELARKVFTNLWTLFRKPVIE